MDETVTVEKPLVLIVDDHQDFLGSLRSVLAHAGYETMTASKASRAINIVHDMRRPGIVLIDWFLQDQVGKTVLLGKDLLEDLKVSARYPIVPIFMSVNANKTQAEIWSLEAGGYQYWDKLSPHELLIAKIHAMEKLIINELLPLSRQDTLTGALTRGEGDRQAIRELRRMARKSQLLNNRRKEMKMACLMIDCDRFKQINDTFGHYAGDKILRMLVTLIQSHLRGTDVVVRYGGDEIVIILPETDEMVAQKVMERVKNDIANNSIPCEKDGEIVDVKVSVSVGLEIITGSEIRNPEEDWARFIKEADHKMYIAKRE